MTPDQAALLRVLIAELLAAPRDALRARALNNFITAHTEK